MLSGKKLLSIDQMGGLITYWGLGGIEADYLMFLLQCERAGTMSGKTYWRKKADEVKDKSYKLSNRIQSDKKLSEVEKSIFYSSPLYMMIRLFTSVGDYGKSLVEISQRFDLEITRCSEIMSFWSTAAFAIKKTLDILWELKTILLEKASPHLVRYHADWRMRAIQRGEDLSDNELLFTSPISVSKHDFDRVREEAILFIKNFLKTVHASPAEEIACLNLDLFWIKK
ncbi:MAG: DUF4423 domain-containing protein [Bdellovibrionales bacterium]|nr:DUF4423 domain-containing protein [Bdellovibrionales bacterium]